MSSDISFTSSYLFIYFFFLILTSLRRYCSILFVALLIPFSYEDKRLRHTIEKRTTDASIDQWLSRVKTCIGAEGGHFKHMA